MEDQKKPSNERLVRQWAGIRMAHEAVMLSDAQANLAIERNAVREHREKITNRESGDNQKYLAGQEDMIHIGDYILQPQAKAVEPSSGSRSGMSKLVKVGLAAAALAAGGIGVGAPLAVSWMLQQKTGESVPVTTDHDTQFELKLLPEE